MSKSDHSSAGRSTRALEPTTIAARISGRVFAQATNLSSSCFIEVLMRFLTALPQCDAGKCFKHFFLRWRSHDTICCKILSLWVIRFENALGSLREVIRRLPKLNVGFKQEPVCTWFTEWHSHTAGIYYSNTSDHSIKLHVGVAADYQRYIESFKDWQETLFRCETGENLVVVSRSGVAKQHLTESVNFDAECFRPAG